MKDNYECGSDEIPEFTSVGAVLALLGAGAIVTLRRKGN